MKKRYIFLFIIFVALSLVWRVVLAPQLLALDDGFRYEADVQSVDNFYDEERGVYQGDQRSVTQFSYEFVDKKEGIYIIENMFSVRTTQGDPIFSTSQYYGIDPVTKKHNPRYGNKERGGYLFAPPRISFGEPFVYWHVNYDGPAQMEFVEREVISGLEVYKYESRYDGVVIDQTDDLSGLPGVPEERGVVVEPYLELWIEPTTGYLVKYQDTSIAYYYNQETKEKIVPWNKFQNNYAQSSVERHIDIAKELKMKHFNVLYASPALLLIVAFTTLLWERRRIATIILIAGVAFVIMSALYTTRTQQDTTERVTIGVAWWVDGTLFSENLRGFKDALAIAGFQDGVEVLYLQGSPSQADAEKHRNLIRSYVDQEVDLIFSLTTPGTLIAKEEVSTIPIVFSVVTYPQKAGIVESLRSSNNNLVGTRNWISSVDQLGTFRQIVPAAETIGFLHRKGEPNSVIQFNEMRDHAELFGIDVVDITPSSREEIQPFLKNALTEDNVDSLYLACDTLIQTPGSEEIIIEFAKTYTLPSFSCGKTGVEKGLLVGTVADFYEIGRLAGEKAALILNGATPSSLETSALSRPLIYINLDRAEELGLVVPQNILTKAEEVFSTKKDDE